MADPIADETLNEWVELYNDENKDGTIIPASGYAIVTDDSTRVYNNFNVSSDAIRLYVDDASIGNGLGNDGETVYLYDNNNDNNLMDKKTYNETTYELSSVYKNFLNIFILLDLL